MNVDPFIGYHADIELARVAYQAPQDLHPGDHSLFGHFLDSADNQISVYLDAKIEALHYFGDKPGPARAACNIGNTSEKPEINIVIVEHVSNVSVQHVEVVAESEVEIHVMIRYHSQVAAHVLGAGQR
jgi:hypothetical protein